MDPLIIEALGTAIDRAFARADHYLSKARAVKDANIKACIEYLRAAQSAVGGLEEEVDEILIETKMVARFYWDKRAALYERIENYLNRDRLSRLLDESIQGLKSCHKFAESDAKGFFLGAAKQEAAVAQVRALLGELGQFMVNLGAVTTYTAENYVHPLSGINIPELLHIRDRLVSESATSQIRTELVEIVEGVQLRRLRPGLRIVADITRVAQELTVVFELQK